MNLRHRFRAAGVCLEKCSAFCCRAVGKPFAVFSVSDVELLTFADLTSVFPLCACCIEKCSAFCCAAVGTPFAACCFEKCAAFRCPAEGEPRVVFALAVSPTVRSRRFSSAPPRFFVKRGFLPDFVRNLRLVVDGMRFRAAVIHNNFQGSFTPFPIVLP